MSNLQFTTSDGGIQVDVKTCRCETCQNYFWIPTNVLNETPSFCCFCGRVFETVSEDNLAPEMRSLFGNGDDGS